MECPTCHAHLEVTDGGRYVAALAGLAMAFVVYRFARISGGLLGWALPIVYAIVALGVVAPLILMLVADVRLAPPEAEPIAPGAATPAAGHSGGHH
jgi:hypothetical protein